MNFNIFGNGRGVRYGNSTTHDFWFDILNNNVYSMSYREEDETITIFHLHNDSVIETNGRCARHTYLTLLEIFTNKITKGKTNEF
jgi:hypothetical protein